MMLKNEHYNKLRELRLWHWNQAMHYYSLANHIKPGVERISPIDTADQHMKFVETLNNFFSVDDIAEKDAMK